MVALSPLSGTDKPRHRDAGARPTAVSSLAEQGGRPTFAINIGASVVFLLLWYLASEYRLVTPLFLPSPLAVAHSFLAVTRDGFADATLLQHASISLMRVSTAFLVAASLGIPLGLIMGLNRWFRGIFSPLIGFYWPIPPLAYLPLVIIWLGIGEVAKIAIITLAMFAPLVIAAKAGVRSISIGSVQAALSLGASRRQLFVHVILPSALPEILTGVRMAIGSGWGTLVAAELVAATKGLGFMTLSASEFLVTDVVFVGIFTIAAFALGFNFALRWLERLLTPWKGKE
jgi:taurine transport system permease protein